MNETVFYDEVIDWQTLFNAIEDLADEAELSAAWRRHAEETVHTTVLCVFLEILPEQHHQTFIQHFHAAPYDAAHWQFLETYAVLPAGQLSVKNHVQQEVHKVFAELMATLNE